ncbi:NUDIX pyrophosphatase, partial [Bacillus cereus]|nr:NUDIX pyrophosphatase [Bacillus cereus]
MRAPYQVLIFPYIKTTDSIQYAIFNQSDYS